MLIDEGLYSTSQGGSLLMMQQLATSFAGFY